MSALEKRFSCLPPSRGPQRAPAAISSMAAPLRLRGLLAWARCVPTSALGLGACLRAGKKELGKSMSSLEPRWPAARSCLETRFATLFRFSAKAMLCSMMPAAYFVRESCERGGTSSAHAMHGATTSPKLNALILLVSNLLTTCAKSATRNLKRSRFLASRCSSTSAARSTELSCRMVASGILLKSLGDIASNQRLISELTS
mmetsp:Transcript_8627/g.35947  ORF Transcript_8627/g.35947 Transcript_8627/m.35947 type:complete len:202 (-) Transcript_8627:1389-1994(-)